MRKTKSNSDNILIDTSIWIAYLEKGMNDISDKVEDIITRCNVFVPKVVIAELIEGSNSENEIHVIEDFLDAFRVVDHCDGAWIRAGKLYYALKKKSEDVTLRDCYISTIAMDHDCSILTLDEHFKAIQRVADINLIEL